MAIPPERRDELLFPAEERQELADELCESLGDEPIDPAWESTWSDEITVNQPTPARPPRRADKGWSVIEAQLPRLGDQVVGGRRAPTSSPPCRPLLGGRLASCRAGSPDAAPPGGLRGLDLAGQDC
jgi:hypothetical protein